MKSKIENLALWNEVSETDPAYTKQAKKGAYNFTAITPVSQFKKATEMFGPQGIGWGIVIGSEKFNETEYGTTIILCYDAILFFILDGQRGEIPIHASEKICYQTQGSNGYMKIDDECRKKVVTNAKTKGLSELGFNADVFMGMFDDPNYVDMRNYEESIEKSDDRQKTIQEKIEEFNDWCKNESQLYKSIKSMQTLTLLLNRHKESVVAKCNLLGLENSSYIRAFDNAYNEQVKSIKEGEK